MPNPVMRGFVPVTRTVHPDDSIDTPQLVSCSCSCLGKPEFERKIGELRPQNFSFTDDGVGIVAISHCHKFYLLFIISVLEKVL